MKITYTGRNSELLPAQQEKLEAKFAKISKLLDQRGEKEAHVILTAERFLHNAEITVNYYDHTMVGAAQDADLFTALQSALEKLEKQVIRARAKWRDTHRGNGDKAGPVPTMDPDSAAGNEGNGRPQVFRVDTSNIGKPMTLEEALLEMEAALDYLVYCDAATSKINVLVRRRDGNFDLIAA